VSDLFNVEVQCGSEFSMHHNGDKITQAVEIGNQLFSKIDTDGDNKISFEQLSHLLTSLGQDLSLSNLGSFAFISSSFFKKNASLVDLSMRVVAEHYEQSDLAKIEKLPSEIKEPLKYLIEREQQRRVSAFSKLQISSAESSSFFEPDGFSFLIPFKTHFQKISQEYEIICSNMVVWPEKEMSTGWSVFGLVAFGKELEGASQCKKTMSIIRKIPNLESAWFSRLDPHSIIKPHVGYHGYSDNLLRAHISLRIPMNSLQCGLRVHHSVNHWKENQILVFDDSLEHEAWNSSDEERILLIVDWKELSKNLKKKSKLPMISAELGIEIYKHLPESTTKNVDKDSKILRENH